MTDKHSSAWTDKKEAEARCQEGRLTEAVSLYLGVVGADPLDGEAWFRLGSLYLSLGDRERSEDCFQKVVALHPGLAIAHGNLGNVYALQGRLEEAELRFREAVRLAPGNALAHSNLGGLLMRMDRSDEAMACLRTALRLDPSLSEANNNLAKLFIGQGRLEEALACLQDVLRVRPHWADAYNNLGDVYRLLGRPMDAESSYREAVRLDPESALAHSNLGGLLKKLNRIDEATTCLQEALRLDPALAAANNTLGVVFTDQGRLDEALACFEAALRAKPDSAMVHNNLGNVHRLKGQLDEALASYREALRLDPRQEGAHSNIVYLLNYRPDREVAELFAEHVRWGEMHGKVADDPVVHDNVPDEGRRLRVGYVCADFNNHPVGIFIEPVLARHDKKRFEIYCYSNSAKHDDRTERLRGYADYWRDIVGWTDKVVAELVRDDGIDILVDLAGHTSGNRLLTLARKPAPVQATWMGYFATTGLKAVDYIIADRFVIRPGEERYYVEQVVCLPNSYLCFAPPRLSITPSPLPALDRNSITFGCFNNPAKLTPRVIAVWAELLASVPGSRLFLKYNAFGFEETRERYRALFSANGIRAERIMFSGRSPRSELLAAYHEVDVALDPFPHNGGTTTVEALWMGVPVISLRGGDFVGRVAESFLTTAGMEQCVVDTEEAYIDKAVTIASDLAGLAALRARLRDQLLNSPLCDSRGFTRDLEAAYGRMWAAWCRNQRTYRKL